LLEGIRPDIEWPSDTICLNAGLVQCQAQPAGPNGSWGGAADLNGLIDPMALGAGTHTLYYSYTDFNGCSTRSDTVHFLIPETLQADITAQVSGDTVLLSTNSNAETLLWELGDGTTAVEPLLQHLYTAPGVYTICLNAFSPCDTLVTCQEVEILASGLDALHRQTVVTLYPNPAMGDLPLTLSGVHPGAYLLDVFSGQGHLVLRQEGECRQGKIYLNAVEDLPAGHYFYHLVLDDTSVSGKFELY
ncbi:MAG: hypothetical protein KDC44_18340, partial [Phaeodactylibacter sp.]|nr:hypothetical protein [Phaeodactylibacter sp.]